MIKDLMKWKATTKMRRGNHFLIAFWQLPSRVANGQGSNPKKKKKKRKFNDALKY